MRKLLENVHYCSRDEYYRSKEASATFIGSRPYHDPIIEVGTFIEASSHFPHVTFFNTLVYILVGLFLVAKKNMNLGVRL